MISQSSDCMCQDLSINIRLQPDMSLLDHAAAGQTMPSEDIFGGNTDTATPPLADPALHVEESKHVLLWASMHD
jgi:hypothetical protein